MNEQDWADRFSQDVDSFLCESGRGGDEPRPSDYRQTLDLARLLATADFSDESAGRAALRRRLLNRVGRQMAMRRGLQGWRAVVVTLLVVAGLCLVADAWPGALAQLLQSLQLGPHTSVQQVVPGDPGTPRPSRPAAPEVMQSEDRWIIRTAIGSFGGNVRPGEPAAVLHFDSMEGAQAASSLYLRRPAYLPAGYKFREALVASSTSGFFFFDGPRGEIVLVQTPVYERVEEQPGGATTSTSVVVGVLSDAPVEEVVVRGNWRAAWFEGHSLVWEAEGVSYTLGGVDLSLDEAIRIAESVG